MPVRNRVELKGYIRFQLSQLSARNAEHEFENLAFELARLRVVPNLLPATGPVQAGGDQGRDFESYRVHLAQSSLATSAFVTAASDGLVVGACTLDKRIVQKVKKDLRTIFSSGEKPVHVAYFCEPDVPVAKRHALQAHCKEQHGALLELFDGQAVSDLLADRDTFWIAEQFLSIPADAWPDEPVDAHYVTLRDRWIVEETIPRNYSDFLDVKQGLRTARLEEETKADLSSWIKIMALFLDGRSPDRLAQKARYEIAVAELRGHGSLDPALPMITEFFNELTFERAPAELLDASVLAVYAWGARAHGVTSIAKDIIDGWVRRVESTLVSAIASVNRRGDRCMLLEARALLGSAPVDVEQGSKDHQSRFFKNWQEVVLEVKDNPLYPVSHIADVLEQVAPIFGQHPGYRPIVDDVDALIAARSGAGAVADRARKRAIAHLDAEQYVSAIDELQRTKVGWLTGEALEGSILSMLVISQSFEALHLHYAARYYAAGALFLALHQENENLKRRLGQAAIRLADTFYAAGEGITFLYSVGDALMAHEAVANDPDDWTKHSAVQRTVTHAVILRAVARRLAPDLVSQIDRAIETWPLPIEERKSIFSLSERAPWSIMPINEIEEKIVNEFGHNPFSDVGRSRSIVWSALGVTWTIRSNADRDAWFAAQEVATTLQIAQVEFADTDLLVVPSHASIEIALDDVSAPKIDQLPDNGSLTWKVVMPREYPEGADTGDLALQIATVAITVLGQATALSFERFSELCDQRFERGLADRLFSVRPARELMKFSFPSGIDVAILWSLVRPSIGGDIAPIEVGELGWRTGIGPGYTKEKADKYLRNRYEITLRALRVSLPRIMRDNRCRNLIGRMKGDGLLDWQILSILASIVCQCQVEERSLGVSPQMLAKEMRERLYREERDDDPQFDLNRLTEELVKVQQQILSAASFATWDLECHRQTPDFAAMKRLLDERYGHSVDDLPHPDPFEGITIPVAA